MHALDKAVCPVCTVNMLALLVQFVFQKLVLLTVCLDQDLGGDATACRLQL